MAIPPDNRHYEVYKLDFERELIVGQRYLRITLNKSGPIGERRPDGSFAHEQKLPEGRLPEQIVIRTNDAEDRRISIGKCIYCGMCEITSGEAPTLTDEHIIARGWGGTIVLRAASCRHCQKHINENIEQPVLTGAFLAPRRRLSIRSRKRKNAITSYEAIAHIDGKDVKLRFPLKDHPTLLLMIGFGVPRRLGGHGGPCSFFIEPFDSFQRAQMNGIESLASHGIDTLLFSQMLAKIAHGYAVWRFGIDGFAPYLCEFIRRKFERDEQHPECYDLVGGHPQMAAPAPPDQLHWLGHLVRERDDKRLLVVGIRLLANLAAPIYWVVAGELKQEPPHLAANFIHE